MNLPRFFCLGKLALIFSVLLLVVSAALADVVTVAVSPYANYGSVSPNYNGKNLTNGNTYSMTATANKGFKFTGWTGSASTNKAKLKFTMSSGAAFTANFIDTQKPAVTVGTPANKSSVSQPGVVAAGAVSENDVVAGVFWQLISLNVPYADGNYASASTANGYKNWWANLSLEAGTNILLVYAVDRSGNFSATNKVKITFAAAPGSVAGTTITATNADNYFITFSAGTNGTFSEKTAVGSYRYLKNGAESGKLWLTYLAPPSAVGADTAALLFTGADSGVFSDAGDFTNSFTWSPAANLALTNLNGAQIVLTSTNGDNQTLLSFFDPPLVTGGLSPVATNNPLTVLLATPYPGNVGDRVAVTLSHLKDVNGIWVTNYPLTLSGSISGISTTNSSTNAVIVLFDTPLYLATHTDAFFPMANTPLTIFTCYYTNYTSADSGVAAIVPAPFAYTNFSPVGSLLKLKRNGTNEFIILTFNDPTNYSGTYYDEAYGIGVTVPVVDTGTFGIEAKPVIFTQPANVNTTNGGTAIFSVVAGGSPPLTYQWQFNGTNLTDGGSLTGSATASLTNSSVTAADAGNYTVVVSNPFDVITNVTPAKLTIGVPPQITVPPSSPSVTNGGTAVFSLTTTGTAPLSYQWQFNHANPNNYTNLNNGATTWGSLITGATLTNLTVTGVTTNDTGYYQVIVKNNYGTATNAATLGILP